MRNVDITILNGLPVTVEYKIGRAEYDVGIMSDYIEEWWITHINGRECKKPPQWIYNRIAADKNGNDKVIDAITDVI